MWLAIDAVKKGEADVCGFRRHTGALMAMARFICNTMPGIDRPAIARRVARTMRGESVVLDLGPASGGDHHHSGFAGRDGRAMASVLVRQAAPDRRPA